MVVFFLHVTDSISLLLPLSVSLLLRLSITQVMLSTFRTDRNFPCSVRLTFMLDPHESEDPGARSETYGVSEGRL